MKKKHSAEQIIRILKAIESSGQSVADACRGQQISEGTYYRWRQKYGGLEVAEAVRLKCLEEENTRLKKLVAELSLDKAILQEVNSKKW